jgi:hypothetical protein
MPGVGLSRHPTAVICSPREIQRTTGLGVVKLAIFLRGATVLSATAVRREEGIAISAVGLITEPAQAEKSTGLGTFGLY